MVSEAVLIELESAGQVRKPLHHFQGTFIAAIIAAIIKPKPLAVDNSLISVLGRLIPEGLSPEGHPVQWDEFNHCYKSPYWSS
jgi:hypothetical protein